jgi:predicted nuclease of predicted toxin-antitoxin system
MIFLVDEDLPRSVNHILRQYGHEAIDVRDIGLRGARDQVIAAYAQKHNLCLLSCDTGFSDIRKYPPATYSGIVVLHLPSKATSINILMLLKSLLEQNTIVNQLHARLAIVEHGRVRIRRG